MDKKRVTLDGSNQEANEKLKELLEELNIDEDDKEKHSGRKKQNRE